MKRKTSSLEDIAKDYDRIAEKYDGWWTDEESLRENTIVKNQLEKMDLTNVLDIGCGTGLYLDLVGDKTELYTGLDISDKMLDILHKNHPKRFAMNESFEEFCMRLKLSGTDLNGFSNIVSIFSGISYVDPDFVRNTFKDYKNQAMLMFCVEGFKPEYTKDQEMFSAKDCGFTPSFTINKHDVVIL